MGNQRPIPTDPRTLVSYLTVAEIDTDRAADCRRVLMQERFALSAALDSGDAAKIAAARDEAVRVATMWQGY